MTEPSCPILQYNSVTGLTLEHCLAFLAGGHERCGAHSPLYQLSWETLRLILSSFDGIWCVVTDYDGSPSKLKRAVEYSDTFGLHDNEELPWGSDRGAEDSTVMLIIRNGIVRWEVSQRCVEPWLFPLDTDCRDYYPLSSVSTPPSDLVISDHKSYWSGEDAWVSVDSQEYKRDVCAVQILTISLPFDATKGRLIHSTHNGRTSTTIQIPEDGRDAQTIIQLCIDPLPETDRHVTRKYLAGDDRYFGFEPYLDSVYEFCEGFFDIKYIRYILEGRSVSKRIKLEGRFRNDSTAISDSPIPPRTGFDFISVDPLSHILFDMMKLIPRHSTRFYLSALAKYSDP